MFHIKLVSIILLCVVYYNEATDQFAIDKRDWETYYLMATSKISDFFYVSIIEFDKINQRYQDDYLSQVIFQRHFAANDLNKKCMSCIQNFVEFELKRWKEIEPTVRYYMTPDNMITGEKHWNKMRDIFINYQRYIDAVKTWITTCSSIIIDGHVDDFPSKIKDQEKNPLISKGISEKMEECIYHYSGKKRNRNLLASTGKIVNADNQLESKPSVLIQQITY
ncbi:uncharacterized protein LOC142333907 isoform X2 [Lycorma delicatula]|uniref:uncharacterized protein LOC142333907 isoform X2 n=1 Tax=Lycorma delicatula TaxID=130591 RepID=UPI003F518AE3